MGLRPIAPTAPTESEQGRRRESSGGARLFPTPAGPRPCRGRADASRPAAGYWGSQRAVTTKHGGLVGGNCTGAVSPICVTGADVLEAVPGTRHDAPVTAPVTTRRFPPAAGRDVLAPALSEQYDSVRRCRNDQHPGPDAPRPAVGVAGRDCKKRSIGGCAVQSVHIRVDKVQGSFGQESASTRCARLTDTNVRSYRVEMPDRQYEARCTCGNRWRVYRTDADDNDDPMATCIDCGADTYDLTDIGEIRSAGRDMPG